MDSFTYYVAQIEPAELEWLSGFLSNLVGLTDAEETRVGMIQFGLDHAVKVEPKQVKILDNFGRSIPTTIWDWVLDND
jgi:hypothetical protein